MAYPSQIAFSNTTDILLTYSEYFLILVSKETHQNRNRQEESQQHVQYGSEKGCILVKLLKITSQIKCRQSAAFLMLTCGPQHLHQKIDGPRLTLERLRVYYKQQAANLHLKLAISVTGRWLSGK